MLDISDKFVPQDGIYLISHSVGLPPVTTQDYIQRHYFDPWIHNTADVWWDWLASIDVFRKQLGQLLSSHAGNFCPQVNISSALTKILYSRGHLDQKKTILLSEKAFPSLGFVFERAQTQGFQIKFVPSSKPVTDSAVWEEYLTEDVAWVLVTHVHSNTNERSPVDEVIKLARNRGIVSIVDVAQSSGVVPIDIDAWGADFVLGSSLKWLCGGPGASFLWVNPDILKDCQPLDVGWFSHEEPFEFDIHQFRYAKDALRFWGGTPDIVPFIAATNSIDLIHSIGVKRIRRHNRILTEQLIAALPPGATLVSPRDSKLRGGTVVLRFDNHDEVDQKLKAAGIKVDGRADGMRLSPHIYNTAGQIERVVAVLHDC